MNKKISIILIVARTIALTGCGNKSGNDLESGKMQQEQKQLIHKRSM